MAAASRLMSMNKSKASSLLHTLRPRPNTNLQNASVSSTDHFLQTIGTLDRTVLSSVCGGMVNQKKIIDLYQHQRDGGISLFDPSLADQFRVEVRGRGRPVINDEDENDEDDEESDGDEFDAEFCEDDDHDGNDDDGDCDFGDTDDEK